MNDELVEQPSARRFEKLTRRDWLFLAICAGIFALSLFIALRYFADAFPEAAIDFRYDRSTSRALAERLLATQLLDPRGMKHVAVFDGDQEAKVFLERSIGLKATNEVARRGVLLWFWHHRWFRPLEEEELAVDVAPSGEIVSFSHHIPEARALPDVSAERARTLADAFLEAAAVPAADLALIAQSERRLPKRLQRIFTYQSKSTRPAGAPYWHTLTLDGGVVTSYHQRLRVPDQWRREYRELRSKNLVAGQIDAIFLGVTLIAALWLFIIRLRRGDMQLRFLLAIGLTSVVLVLGVTLNAFPMNLAQYDTTTSFPAFITGIVIFAIIQAIGAAILLMIVSGAGEVLYRDRLPHQLALPRLWTRRALTSRRVFRSFVLGYTLVAFFVAYQVAFYIVAGRFGAWAPAEIPYDDMLNTALPWVAVLFAGFFPSLSEEFLSRAFSIPLLQKILSSRAAAIVIAGFIWGFGHTTYPNQPFYIRGLEVGVAGVLLGVLMDAFGLLPLLIWHYTVDAFYTALLLFRSGNTYYVASAGVASFLFVFPMLVSIVLYLKNGGFAPDDDLTNATLPLAAKPAEQPAAALAPLPDPIPVTRRRVLVALVAVSIATVAILYRPATPDDAINFKTTKSDAKRGAKQHLISVAQPPPRLQVIAAPAEGFRSWNRDSSREDGGAPGGFDLVAAEYVMRHSSLDHLIDAMKSAIPAGGWAVRFFTPLQKEEWFVHVEAKSGSVIGYHKYQDEKKQGATLERGVALDLAWRSFPLYGVELQRFEMKEALVFQQPSRRDWLFHFDEQQRVAGEARRRVTVRVAGSEVTQFATTINVPEDVYREASKQTVGNVVLMVLKLAAIVGLLTLIVTGFVTAAFRQHVDWRGAARWTLILAIIPIAGAVASYESDLFRYATFMRWETFMTDVGVSALRDLGVRVGVLFLAIAGASAAFPSALRLFTAAGRRRLGAAAVTSALAAIALLATLDVVALWPARMVPALARIPAIDIPQSVALPLPALLAAGDAIYAGIIGSAAIALFLYAIPRRIADWKRAALVVIMVFGVSLDPDAKSHHIPLMLAAGAVSGFAIWAIARFVTRENPLAYPIAIFTVTLLQSAAAMLQNDRTDLQMNGYAAIAMTCLTLIWIAWPRGGPELAAQDHA